jgi:serralysin
MATAATTVRSDLTAAFSSTDMGNIKSLFAQDYWAVAQLSYSFPDAADDYQGTSVAAAGNAALTGFAPATPGLRVQIQRVLQLVESFTDLTFIKADPQTDSRADLRIAMTDTTATAFGYFPGTSANAGDSWFATSQPGFATATTGTYGGFAPLHEIGHTLGLKPPHAIGGLARHNWPGWTATRLRR